MLWVSSAAASPTVNVKDHDARGDGSTDDTAALQAAVGAVAGTGGTVWVPSGVYMIDASRGVALQSQMTLRLESGAVLRAIPNALDHSFVVLVKGVESVNITGGAIEGERLTHRGTTGEWGNGIEIRNSKKITIDRVSVRNCWGDGFYISNKSETIRVSHVLVDRNRRQGLTITSATDVIVSESVFRNTSGTAPESGIDVEPNQGETVANCQVVDCLFIANAGGGLQVGVAQRHTGHAFVTGFLAEGNTFLKNGPNLPPTYTIQVAGCEGAIIRNNQLRGNQGIGIGVLNSAQTTVTGNTVQQTLLTSYKADAGIFLRDSTGTICTGNVVTHNNGYGIFLWNSETDVSGNEVTDNKWGQVKIR